MISFDNTEIAFRSKNRQDLQRAYLLFQIIGAPSIVKIGKILTPLALRMRLPIKGLIKSTIFKQFCGGETIDGCESTIQELEKAKIGTILDYSVEGEESEKSFQKTKEEILKTIRKSAENPAIPFAVFKVTGIFKAELLEKAQTEAELTEEEQELFDHSKDLLMEICDLAHALKVRLFIDAEESWIQTTIDQLTYEMMAKYNQETAIIYNTFQMYRHDMLANLKEAIAAAEEKNYFLGVKLVRGAYLEKERQKAHEDEYSEPLHVCKEDTDRDYDLGVELCLKHVDRVHFCMGTHNESSCLRLCDAMNALQIPSNHPNIYFAQLLGMSDNISYNLAASGYNVAKYVPYGPVDAVMPYLFRRAEENSSIAGQTSREFALLQKEVNRRNNA